MSNFAESQQKKKHHPIEAKVSKDTFGGLIGFIISSKRLNRFIIFGHSLMASYVGVI